MLLGLKGFVVLVWLLGKIFYFMNLVFWIIIRYMIWFFGMGNCIEWFKKVKIY